MKIITVIGARPQIIKAAAISREISKNYSNKITEIIIHTGQHYDKNMSSKIMADLNFEKPDFYLGASSGTFSEQSSKIMIQLEKICTMLKPSLALVAGDVNSSLS